MELGQPAEVVLAGQSVEWMPVEWISAELMFSRGAAAKCLFEGSVPEPEELISVILASERREPELPIPGEQVSEERMPEELALAAWPCETWGFVESLLVKSQDRKG